MNDTIDKIKQSPWWNRDILVDRLPKLMARQQIAATLRDWFQRQNFIEVETSYIQNSPGSEPHMIAFETIFTEPFETDGQKMYLHFSPEYAMKKLLTGGMERIFQFARCFRRGERSPIHHPEFTMLEWYRLSKTYSPGYQDAEALVKTAAKSVNIDVIFRNDKTCDLKMPFVQVTVREAFREFCGVDLNSTICNPLQPDRDLLAKMAADNGIRVHKDDNWETVFDRIFLEKIEPNLGFGRGTIVTEWPLPLAALAKPLPGNPCLSERFEIYVCGMELVNGFGELRDVEEHRRRFAADIQKKHEMGLTPYPIDEDFLDALACGLPESVGVAMGFDRLVMLITGAENIDEVLWTPFRKN